MPTIESAIRDGLYAVADSIRLFNAPVEVARVTFRIAIAEQDGPVTLTPQFQRESAGAISVMAEITATQKIRASVTFTDSKGNPATVDAPPVWGVDNPNVVALAPDGEGYGCDISAVGPLGTALVSVTADADLGQGVTPVAGTLEVTVTAGSATTVSIDVGEPEEQ